MKRLQYTGVYLLFVLSVLMLLSIWQLKVGSGHADFSFVLFLPFAIGLLRPYSWARWGAGILGFLSAIMVLVLAAVGSGLSGLTVRLGPITMVEPSTVQMWTFAAVYMVALGVPMISVLFTCTRKAVEA